MRWDLEPENISKQADELIAKSKTAYDAVGALKKEDVTYDNTIQASHSLWHCPTLSSRSSSCHDLLCFCGVLSLSLVKPRPP